MKRKHFIKQLMAVGISPRSAAAFAEWAAVTGREYFKTLGALLNLRAWLIANTYRPDRVVYIERLQQCLQPIPPTLPSDMYSALRRRREKVATLDAMVKTISGVTLADMIPGGGQA